MEFGWIVNVGASVQCCAIAFMSVMGASSTVPMMKAFTSIMFLKAIDNSLVQARTKGLIKGALKKYRTAHEKDRENNYIKMFGQKVSNDDSDDIIVSQ